MIFEGVMLILFRLLFVMFLAYQGPVLELHFPQVYFHIRCDEPGGFE